MPETERVALTEVEIKFYERIEDTGNTQGLAASVNQTVRDHMVDRHAAILAELAASREALARVEALAEAAETREATSLSRTFDGGSFGAWVDAHALRAALATRSR